MKRRQWNAKNVMVATYIWPCSNLPRTARTGTASLSVGNSVLAFTTRASHGHIQRWGDSCLTRHSSRLLSCTTWCCTRWPGSWNPSTDTRYNDLIDIFSVSINVVCDSDEQTDLCTYNLRHAEVGWVDESERELVGDSRTGETVGSRLTDFKI